MDPTSSIRKLGFRRWYERELIKCHAALVTCLLCGVLMAALIEQVSFTEFGWQPVSAMAVAAGAAVLAWLSWRSYITILQRAEFYGERSNCPGCGAYGRFDVVATGMDEEAGRVANAVAPLPAAWLRVQCRNCGVGWRMPE
jgi:formate dehydrogenase maturation protein FdhE